nr:hypothetical protein [Tanacetum cinerariifolium]
NVREVSKASMFGLKNLQEQVLSNVLNEQVPLNSVDDGKNMMKKRMRSQKVLLVLDDVDHIEQLKALAGSFLCGKDKLEWEDAIDRLKSIPLKDTLEKLELSYIGLEGEYKEIFLDIACILKGKHKADVIRILECCGFHARIGLKVLEQRSLITIREFDQTLGMHDHIEELGKNIVRRLHPDEPYQHSHLWIDDEIEDILANDMGTEATRCLKLDMSRGNSRIVMKVLGKMKKLRQYFPNSLKYLKCWHYPFLYLPKTFQANNLVGLEMERSRRMVQLWEEGEKKVLKKLKFLNLFGSSLRRLDLELFPNLERLDLEDCDELVEINAPVGCLKSFCFLRFTHFKFRGRSEPKVNCSSATLNLVGVSLFRCPLHPSSNLPKFRFHCSYEEYLPSSVVVGNIQKLISFGLCACTDLKKISDMIFSLQYLKKLTLACNIPEFPKDLGQLECLEELCLYSKKIKHLPDSICMLKHLKSLTVDDSDLFREVATKDLCYEMFTEDILEKLPADLGQLECLEKLKVSSMKIEYLPDSICKLKRLKCLDVRECYRLGKLPEDIGRLDSLEILNLSYTSIKHLPDSICMLKHLKFLNLFDCFLLEKLPEDLGQLECLETLYVSSQKIKYLPDSICMLKRLKWLYVTECCRLGKLPDDIGQLESLERLDLSAAMIKHLPDSICMLKHLKYLNLHLCAFLEKLPEDLDRLECLEKLDITHTRISRLPQSIFGLKGLSIAASSELLQLYEFPSEINTTTLYFRVRYCAFIVECALDLLQRLERK